MFTALILALAVQAPNDPYFNAQWGLQMLHVPEAWEVTTGSAAIEMVDIDSGIAPHADLGNVLGDPWDACNQHGTLMAGTIAATPNNGQGIAGIVWTPNLTVYSVLGTRDGIAAGIDRARTTSNAKVVLVEFAVAELLNQNPIKASVQQFTAGGNRILIVPAGGPEDWSGGHSIGRRNDPNVLIVGACDLFTGNLAPYSNFGGAVDLYAPGHATSTTPPGDSYGAGDGTSQAAAYVMGVAGLVQAVNPALSGSEVATILVATADPIPAGLLVNAHAAVLAAQP